MLVWHEGGLRVVEEGGARGEVEQLELRGHEVDARGRGPLGALFQEDLGERVGRELLGGVEGLEVVRVVPREQAGAGRGFEPPRADGDGSGGGDDGRGREAVVDELGELLADPGFRLGGA